ncbi:hypothetical protein [Eubacterium sp. AB3007]|uniref:hypothetical protein n=1 Tax=Eubacterium sp. AB3007 TaxID=1392487 RepID=UPI000A6F09DD|nr:hypothetical protein [Eubacterium sp. AB3007]
MRITMKTLKELDRKIEEEKKDIKRKTFLIATRNRYSKQLGVKSPYENWFAR